MSGDLRRPPAIHAMRSSFQHIFLSGCLVVSAACSSTSPSSSASNGGSDSGGSAAVAGANSGGDSALGGDSSAGAGGNAGASGAPAGSGGASAGSGGVSGVAGVGGSAGGGGNPNQPMNFTCNEYLGLLTTNEWYSQGFEGDGVDGMKWELKYHHYGYVKTWADPTSPFWADTGDSFDLQKGSPLQSPCAANSTAPDRLVFAALDWEMLNEADWLAALESTIPTFKQKYPSLRWLDVMTMIRCPNNQKCNPNANYGPGANSVAGRQDCYVPPYEDSAIEKFAALHPDFVGVGPKVEAPACRMPVDGAHLSADSNKAAALQIAKYYAQHP